MKKIFTKEWAKATAVRAIKTVAQTAIATIGVSAVMTDVKLGCGRLGISACRCVVCADKRCRTARSIRQARNNYE